MQPLLPGFLSPPLSRLLLGCALLAGLPLQAVHPAGPSRVNKWEAYLDELEKKYANDKEGLAAALDKPYKDNASGASLLWLLIHTSFGQDWDAAHGPCVQLLDRLLRLGADPNRTDSQGNLPLQEAIKTGRYELACRLIGHPATDLNRADETSSHASPLHLAVVQPADSLEVLEALLDARRADLNLRDQEGNTPLIAAVLKGTDEAVHLLLTEDSTDLYLQDREGRTARDIAARKGCWSKVALLLEAEDLVEGDAFVQLCCDKYEPQFQGHRGPLLFREKQRLAALRTCLTYLKSLYRNDNIRLKEALEIPLLGNEAGKTLLELLMQAEARPDLVEDERVRCVDDLFRLSPALDINARGKDGYAALHRAAGFPRMQCRVGYCTQRKCFEPGCLGYNTRKVSGFASCQVVGRLLQEKSLDVNLPGPDGGTVLLLATKACTKEAMVYSSSLEVIRMLLRDPRTDPNQADKDGNFPLLVAARHGLKEVVDLLLQHPRLTLTPTQRSRVIHVANEGKHAIISKKVQADPTVTPV